MRFGKSFHQLLVPEFEHYYIDYNQRKASIKELHIKGQGVGSTYHILRDDLHRIEELHKDILAREKEITNDFHIKESPAAIAVHQFRHLELVLLAEGYRGLLGDLKNLRWFDRVNRSAALRLFGKLKRIDTQNKGRHDAQQAEWFDRYDSLEEETTMASRRIGKLLGELDAALINQTPDPLAVPLKETPWRFGSASDRLPNIGSLHQMVLQGDATRLIQLTHPDSAYDHGLVQPGQVLKYLILNKLDATAIQILEQSPKYVQSLDHDCFLFCLQVAHVFGSGDNGSTYCEGQRREEELLPIFQRMLQLCPSTNRLSPKGDGWIQDLLTYAVKHNLHRYSEAILSLGGHTIRPDWVVQLMRAPRAAGSWSPFHSMICLSQDLFPRLIECLSGTGNGQMRDDTKTFLAKLLTVAVGAQNDDAVGCLINTVAGIPFELSGPSQGENALHLATLEGCVDYVNLLLANIRGKQEAVDFPEPRRGLTALGIACVHGHEDVVKALLAAGADISKTDVFGWTAKEHAVYRGHYNVAGLLGDWDRTLLQGGPATNYPAISKPVAPTLKLGEQAIIVNLGSVQARLNADSFQVSCCSPSPAAAAKANISYHLTVSTPRESCAGDSATSMEFELPLITDDLKGTTCMFILKEDAMPVLTFRIITRNRMEPSKDRVVGIGSAVLEGIQLAAGCPRENLIRERTAAILDCDTMEVMHTVPFTFVRATPYPYLQDPLEFHGGDGMKIVGHRGLGQNLGKERYLQIGENTIQSFLAAAKCGASVVEFDLQLTRDLEAVSYHDLSFSESGTDIPIHDLTLEQFRYASKVQSSQGNPASVIGNLHHPTSELSSRPRSRSVGDKGNLGAAQVQDRVKLTVDFRAKGFKPNTRSEFIHDSLVILEEILKELPEEIGLNIEFKHPRIHETVAAGVAPVAIEINRFIDVALDKIRHCAGNKRPLIFSSFTPDICILLSLKQRAYPVLFITNAGRPPLNDMDRRAASVQTAVHFARQWGLAGVVFASEPFVACPRLVRFVKNAGLLCGTYGPQNNDPDNVKLQADAGVDMMVTDRVGLIAKTLAGR